MIIVQLVLMPLYVDFVKMRFSECVFMLLLICKKEMRERERERKRKRKRKRKKERKKER